MQFVNTSEEEINISKKYETRNNSEKKNYLNTRFDKPWGYEYLTYQTENIGIWILHINKNEKTSLHCHFKKDTMLIGLSGSFRIDTYNDFYILNENQSMYFPSNTFHGIMSYSEIGIILEIEIYSNEITYSDKDDLLRLKDIYNRDKNTYSSSVVEKQLSDENSINFHIKSNFIIGNSEINIKKYNSKISSVYLEKYENTSVKILLDGKIVFNNILAPGSMLKCQSDIKLINNECTIMEINNLYFKENSKIVHSKEHLTDIIKKYNFENIGLTSGCFDILHKGHINNLKLAKNNCDTLFVCLSSDKQIRELKGKNRPINCIFDRIRMLSHMNFVDYIILYNETDNNTEQELDNIMHILKPDFWFKGNDYNEYQIRKKHPVLKKIYLFNNIPEISTTMIVNKMT